MRKVLIGGIVLVVALMSVMGAAFAQEGSDTTTTTAWLGVAVADQNEQVIISRVQPNSPAAAAELLIGDVIVSFNDEAVTSASDLSDKVKAAAVGDVVTLELLRAGEAVSVEVTLAERAGRGGRDGNRGLDLSTAEPLTAAEWLFHADLEAASNGFTVVTVIDQFNPYQLEAGDVITQIGDQAAADLDLQALKDSLSAMDNPQLTITVVRDGEEMTLQSDFMGGRRGFDGDGRPGRGGRGLPGNNGNSPNNLNEPAAPTVDGQA